MRILGWFALQVVGGPALPTSPLASAAAAAVAVLAGAGGGWDVSGRVPVTDVNSSSS